MGKFKIRYLSDEILEMMKQDLGETYSIGLHNIKIQSQSFLGRVYKPIQEQKKLFRKGWDFSKYSNSILATTYCFGLLHDILTKDRTKDHFLAYNYWHEEKARNIIVAVPSTIQIDGKTYFLGVLDQDAYENVIGAYSPGLHFASKVLVGELFTHRVPPEFIYGAYTRNRQEQEEDDVLGSVSIPQNVNFEKLSKQSYHFVKNPRHISNMDPKEQESFLKSYLLDHNISMEKLEQVQENNLTEQKNVK